MTYRLTIGANENRLTFRHYSVDTLKEIADFMYDKLSEPNELWSGIIYDQFNMAIRYKDYGETGWERYE